jgi:superfamily I DNA and/or RNA helicase
MSATRHEDHFAKLRELLDLESRAEALDAAERAKKLSGTEAEATGRSLVDLVVIDSSFGVGGRIILELRKRSGRLPWTRLDAGAPVVLSAAAGSSARPRVQRGVVLERGELFVRVAMDASQELSEEAEVRIDLSYDEIAIDRQRMALEEASRVSARSRLGELRSMLLGERAPTFVPADGSDPIHPFAALDRSQEEAVRFALSANDVALIHGPPGTGKTSALVELIRQAVRRRRRVLACAPSNTAVDNLLERLARAGERVVRIGHPARVLPELVEHTLDAMVDRHEDVRLARKLVREARALRRKADKWTRAKPEPGEKREMRDEVRALFADARRLERQAEERILDSADIICSTTSVDGQVLGDRAFDLVVIDEACQSTEPGCWVPILRARKLVLAGDHRQLPPTILSNEAARGGLGVSLFERLAEQLGGEVMRRLDRQYRMHRSIMSFSSREFYQGTLEADRSVENHLLADIEGVERNRLTESPVDLIDTAGAGYTEEIEPDGESRRNTEEAALVVESVAGLIAAGIAPPSIAVIAPYAAQVRLIRQAVEEMGVAGLEIDTVDGFQGREKEAVVISFVRSNEEREIGFLEELRRTNVALTRARRKLIVIGDGATLSANDFYRRLIEWSEEIGAYRTVWEEGG